MGTENQAQSEFSINVPPHLPRELIPLANNSGQMLIKACGGDKPWGEETMVQEALHMADAVSLSSFACRWLNGVINFGKTQEGINGGELGTNLSAGGGGQIPGVWGGGGICQHFSLRHLSSPVQRTQGTHARTHRHALRTANKTEQKGKQQSGGRSLLRSCRAVLNVFWSVEERAVRWATSLRAVRNSAFRRPQ